MIQTLGEQEQRAGAYRPCSSDPNNSVRLTIMERTKGEDQCIKASPRPPFLDLLLPSYNNIFTLNTCTHPHIHNHKHLHAFAFTIQTTSTLNSSPIQPSRCNSQLAPFSSLEPPSSPQLLLVTCLPSLEQVWYVPLISTDLFHH